MAKHNYNFFSPLIGRANDLPRQSIASSRMGVLPRRAFTLIELLIVMAIIALLAMILFPVFARVRENAKRASCASNLKHLALGMKQYAQDYDEKLPEARPSFIYVRLSDESQVNTSTPPASWGCGATPTTASSATPTTCVQWFWPDLIYPYVKSAKVFNDPSNVNQYFTGCRYSGISAPHADVACGPPSVEKPWVYRGPLLSALNPNATGTTPLLYRRDRTSIAYGYPERIGSSVWRNPALADSVFALTNGHLNGFSYPAETILLTEGSNFTFSIPANTSVGSRSGQLIPRHLAGLNVAFADGHVKWLKWEVVSAHPVFIPAATPNPEMPHASASEVSRKLWLPDYSSP